MSKGKKDWQRESRLLLSTLYLTLYLVVMSKFVFCNQYMTNRLSATQFRRLSLGAPVEVVGDLVSVLEDGIVWLCGFVSHSHICWLWDQSLSSCFWLWYILYHFFLVIWKRVVLVVLSGGNFSSNVTPCELWLRTLYPSQTSLDGGLTFWRCYKYCMVPVIPLEVCTWSHVWMVFP